MTETFMKWLKEEECQLEGETTSSCVEVGGVLMVVWKEVMSRFPL